MNDSIIFKIVLGISVVSSSCCMDYHELKEEAKKRALEEPSATHQLRWSKYSSPLIRLCNALESGVAPELIEELYDDGSLNDFAQELLTRKDFLEDKTFVRTMKAVFVITSSFLEKRRLERARHVRCLQAGDMIAAEMKRIAFEIKERQEEIASLTVLVENERSILTNIQGDLARSIQKSSTLQGKKLPQSLVSSNVNRLQACKNLETPTKTFIEIIEARITLCLDQIQEKNNIYLKLSTDQQTLELVAIESISNIAMWDEGLIKMGLDYRGTVSPALLVELIEEHLSMKKLFNVDLKFTNETMKDEFEKIRKDIEFIKGKTDTCAIV